MIHFDKTWFGGVKINGQDYRQVLVVGEEIEERDEEELNKLYGTTHRIGPWEVEKLLFGKPDVIIVGNGQSGVLEVTEEVREKIETSGVELRILLTSQAISEFNKLYSSGKKVNALIHTTC